MDFSIILNVDQKIYYINFYARTNLLRIFNFIEKTDSVAKTEN